MKSFRVKRLLDCASNNGKVIKSDEICLRLETRTKNCKKKHSEL